MTRRLHFVGALTAVCALGIACATPAWAGADTTRHVRYTFALGDVFPAPYTSEVCGFEVIGTIDGRVNVSLIYDSPGLVAREVDTTAASTVTFSAPSTGASFSFPNALVYHFDYGSGAAIGSPVQIRITGLSGHVSGLIPSDAGSDVFLDGVVVGFDENVPVVEFGEPTASHGNREDTDRITSSICTALSGS
jgi:hypothetical protein